MNYSSQKINHFKISPPANYDSLKKSILAYRQELNKKYISANDSVKSVLIAQAKLFIETTLISKIIPAWYTTPWDFEGYTAIPKKGKVACGYFVSTTLLHAGCKLNRYTLAQKSPFNEAYSLNFSDSVITFSNLSKQEVIDTMLQDRFANGIYFVGLDFHVGYLHKLNNELYFIHSNYINSAGVMREKAMESNAFGGSVYYIVPLTPNRTFIEAWIQNREIKTLKGK